jgi:hypothetical protein
MIAQRILVVQFKGMNGMRVHHAVISSGSRPATVVDSIVRLRFSCMLVSNVCLASQLKYRHLRRTLSPCGHYPYTHIW